MSMSRSLSKDFNSLFIVKQQFFACVNLKSFNWEDILEKCCSESTGIETQHLLLQATLLCPLNVQHPIRLSYQKAFLKLIINHLEAKNAEIHDEIYQEYVECVNKVEHEQIHLHFFLKSGEIVLSIAETLSCISNGTTGLSTWPAARVLAEFLTKNPGLCAGKNILELGCGTGLLGLAVIKVCGPKKYIFSDCNPTVLKLVSNNINLTLDKFICQQNNSVDKKFAENSEDLSLESGNFKNLCSQGHSNETSVNVVNLPWEEIESDRLSNIDLVVAADVIYDVGTVGPLVRALHVFESSKIIFACAVRNPETFAYFLKVVGEFRGRVTDINIPACNTFYASFDVPLKLFEVSFD